MKIAVLCPGPSLTRFPGRGDYAAVIGVNRAACHVSCDWWACGDHPLISRIHGDVIGKPALFTALAGFDHLNQHGPRWRGKTLTFNAAFAHFPQTWEWDLFSATAAAVLAAHLGGTRIDIWGSDLTGTRDWDGVEAGANRTDERWRCEAGIWRRLSSVLGERGCEVTRR
jgi:hypothetical protein